jgi:APA family basic amino acid/polyamine antiporter
MMVYYPLFSEIHENSHTMENKPFFYGFVSLFAGLVPVSDLGHGKYFIGFVLVCFWYIGRKKMPDAPREL